MATTVKSSPHAAWTIRLPTISPPMTQGPVRDLKSPTPSCPNLLDPTVIRRPYAVKKSNKMVYYKAVWLNIRFPYLDVSAARSRKFHTDDVTRVSVSDWLLLGFELSYVSSSLWHFPDRTSFERGKIESVARKDFSFLSQFDTISFEKVD